MKSKSLLPKSRKGWVMYPILGLLVIGAFLLRAIPQWDKVFVNGNVWFRGVDSWYHMRLVDNMQANFPVPLKWDMFAAGPDGGPVSYFPLMSWLIPNDAIGALLPPILGALILIPVYFICKEVFSKGVGLLACLLATILPGEFLHRSLLGFTDHHIFEVFFATLTIMFLVLATNRVRYIKKQEAVQTRYLILAGVSLGLYLISWMGGLLLVLPIWLWYVIAFTLNLAKGQPTYNLTKTVFVTLLIAFVIYLPVSFFVYVSTSLTLFLLVVTVTPLLFQWLSTKLRGWERFLMVILGMTLVVVVSLVIWYPGVFAYPRNVLFGFVTTIEEAGSVTPQIVFAHFGLTILLFIGGLWYAIKTKKNLLFLVWTIILLFAYIGQRRWGYYFTINAAILASYFIFLTGSWVNKNIRTAVVVVICVFVLAVSVKGTIGVVNLPNNITPGWYNACTWLRTNTPEPFGDEEAYYELEAGKPEYGILSWWDYGHWIIRIGHRVPMASPTYGSGITAEFLAAQSEEEANKAIEGLSVKYVIIDKATVTGKFYAIAEAANKSTEPRQNSMAVRLWLNQTETWKLVYQFDEVKVFERSY